MYGSFGMLLGYKVKNKKNNLRGQSYIMDYPPPKKTAKLGKNTSYVVPA